METTASIQPGDHCALIFKTRTEQFHWVCSYIRDGLHRNERCLYIAHENSVPSVLNHLERAGIDTQSAQRRRALEILTREQSYLKFGIFEPTQMIADLKREVDSALAHGFTGLRASGEMTWALDMPQALGQLRQYEMDLHRNFGPRLTGLCQYDQTRFEPQLLSDVIRIHPKLIANGRILTNPFHRPLPEIAQGSLPLIQPAELAALS